MIVSGMPLFTELNNKSLSIKSSTNDIGTYPLTIILRDLNKFSMVSTYNIELEISESYGDDIVSDSLALEYL